MKKLWTRATLAFAVLAFVGAIGFGCAQVQSGNPSTQNYGVLMGTVKDSSGAMLSGVTVTLTSSSGATNAEGWFNLANIAENTREIVTFSKTGYVTTQKTFPINSGQVTFAEMVLNTANSAHTFTASAGSTISDTASSGLTATVTIAAGSLVDSSGAAYSGAAKFTLTPMDPTVSPECFPGNFEGVNSSGATVPFRSFGYMTFSLTDNSNNTLNLAAGNSMQVNMQVPANLTSEAATAGTVPMWYFDTSTAKWMQSGTATYDATSQRFIGTISRGATGAFADAPVVLPTIWNFDLPFSNSGTISGKVVDAFGNAVANALVVCDGSGFRATGYTGSDGKFSSITAPSGISLTYYAQKGGNRSLATAISPNLTSGENRALSDITISLASVMQITLNWGENPRDLDSHLTVPSSESGGARYHLYWSNRGSTPSTTWPYVKLDTDDTSSYGPEVVSAYKLYQGTYRYCVHDYAGSSDITNSGATVNLIVSSGSSAGIYNFTPPSGATGVDDVWNVCDISVDSGGNVSSISTLGNIIHNIATGSHESFSPNNAATIGSLGVSSVGFIDKKR